MLLLFYSAWERDLRDSVHSVDLPIRPENVASRELLQPTLAAFQVSHLLTTIGGEGT